MIEWKAILLIYRRIDVRYRVGSWRRKRFVHTLSDQEVSDAVASFQEFPGLIEELTSQRATVCAEIIHVDRPLSCLTPLSTHMYWPGPSDIRKEIEHHAAANRLDSIFVLWPQNSFADKTFIPSPGWGLGMGASDSTFGATYATVANAPTQTWQVPRVGEVWLHEWLHGVCAHFEAQGHIMPDGNADGGDRHGYVQSPITGWMDYYRDLMNGLVAEDGRLTGIKPEAWGQHPQSGAKMA